jgi:hypothetical protein
MRPLPIGSSTITMAQRHVQWTRLPDGETSAVFTEQVKRLLSPAPLRAPNRARQAEASLSTPGSVGRSSEYCVRYLSHSGPLIDPRRFSYGAKMVQRAQLTVKEERLTARRYESTARKHHKLVRLFDLIRQ